IASYGEFSFCEVWLPTLHQKALKLSAYADMNTAAKKFHKHSKNIVEMAFDAGLPGKVWSSKDSVIWENVETNELFVRNTVAKEVGLKAVLGIPLMYQENTVGVLVVGSTETTTQMNQYQAVLGKMKSFIGSKINRKRLESELQHLFDTLPDLICVTDEKGRFLKINKVGCELLGCNEHDVIGNTIEAFTRPLDKTIFKQKRKEAKKRKQTSFSFENRYITKKKEMVWLSWHCNVVKNEGLIYATAKNITEEKKLQELVTDASKMARIGGWEIDLVSNKVNWSKVLYEIHETDPETFVPTPENTTLFFREDYREEVTNIITEAVNTKSTFDFEAPIITANKNQVWVRSVGTTEFVGNQCVRIYGSFQDINLRKETELRLKSITDDLPGVAFQYFTYPDGTNKLESVSEASRKIWNLSPEECENNNALVWNQIKKGGDYDTLIKDIEASVKNLSQWHSKWRNVLPNGELRWHEGYGTPYKLSNGTILFNSMIFDITNEVQLTNLYDETSRLSKIGSWELDLTKNNTDAMYWSPVVREIIEVDANYDASLSGGIEFYTEESKIVVKKAIEQLIEKGIDYDEEVLLITKTGKEKWVRIIGKSERINGVCTKIFGSIQDIHASKSTKLRLQEILGSISDAFLALDEDWNFIYFNKEAENILNKKSSEVIGKCIWDILPYIKGTELEKVYHKVA
ncbi:MAG TPA: PAS domain-containing protein, partial [Flavobacteriaceae bacterium]|nr:PAS domain-containing protein [Flavobacteriaceae bacterium]